jgi:hypothetical protein
VMTEELLQKMHLIQNDMAADAQTCFLDSDVENLRVVIRLTFEFGVFLGSSDLEKKDRSKIDYRIGSIFSGIDCFCSLSYAYRMLANKTDSEIGFDDISLSDLPALFSKTFDSFIAEASFEKKCRLLLDMFKLQIVYAGALF